MPQKKMTPRRGQPPKPKAIRKVEQVGFRVTKAEKDILEKAHRFSGSTESFSRWMAKVSIEEARRIITKWVELQRKK